MVGFLFQKVLAQIFDLALELSGKSIQEHPDHMANPFGKLKTLITIQKFDQNPSLITMALILHS